MPNQVPLSAATGLARQGAGLSIQLNGQVRSVASSPDTPLLYVLRDEFQLHGPKFGCGLGQCGACTVHVGDRADIRSALANNLCRCGSHLSVIRAIQAAAGISV